MHSALSATVRVFPQAVIVEIRRYCWICVAPSTIHFCYDCAVSIANLCPGVAERVRPIWCGFTVAFVRITNKRRRYNHGATCIHLAFHSQQECGPIYCDVARYSYAIAGLDGQFRVVTVDFFTETKSSSTKRINGVQLYTILRQYILQTLQNAPPDGLLLDAR